MSGRAIWEMASDDHAAKGKRLKMRLSGHFENRPANGT